MIELKTYIAGNTILFEDTNFDHRRDRYEDNYVHVVVPSRLSAALGQTLVPKIIMRLYHNHDEEEGCWLSGIVDVYSLRSANEDYFYFN